MGVISPVCTVRLVVGPLGVEEEVVEGSEEMLNECVRKAGAMAPLPAVSLYIAKKKDGPEPSDCRVLSKVTLSMVRATDQLNAIGSDLFAFGRGL